jgi:hypothetical protein
MRRRIMRRRTTRRNEEGGKEKRQESKEGAIPISLQITVALETHSDSHAKFFDHYYDRWTKGLSDFDVKPQFLWIIPEQRQVKKHKACEHKFPEHNERYIHLGEVNEMIWQKYQSAKRGAKGDTG